VIHQDHMWNSFRSAGKLIGDVQELREVGTDWLAGNRTQLAELSEERKTANSGIRRVHLLSQYFPHPHGVLNLVEMYLLEEASRR
jgi:hypothetical protein